MVSESELELESLESELLSTVSRLLLGDLGSEECLALLPLPEASLAAKAVFEAVFSGIIEAVEAEFEADCFFLF